MQFPGPTHRNIYVRSERAGQRVMESVTRFISKRLKLKVNQQKSAVARPQERKFLVPPCGIHPEPATSAADCAEGAGAV